MSLPLRAIAILMIVGIGQPSSTISFGQDKSENAPSTKDSEDKYAFNRDEFRHDPNAGLEKITSLHKQAVTDQAPDRIIAKLSVEKGQMAYQCASFANDYSPVLETLEKLISDPTSLLVDVEEARNYVRAIKLYCSALKWESAEIATRVKVVRNAMDEVDAAMALTERERVLVVADLRLIGSDIATDEANYKEAVLWLEPVLENISMLAEDEYGVDILCGATRQQSMFFSELERWDDCAALVESAVTEIRKSRGVEEPKKLREVAYILSKQLMNLRNHPSNEMTDAAWQEAIQHWKAIENQQHENMPELDRSGLEIGRMSIMFWQNRDVDQCVEVMERIYSQFDAHPELAKSENAIWAAHDASKMLWRRLSESKDPRNAVVRDRFIEFLNRLESLGADKEKLNEYRSKMLKTG